MPYRARRRRLGSLMRDAGPKNRRKQRKRLLIAAPMRGVPLYDAGGIPRAVPGLRDRTPVQFKVSYLGRKQQLTVDNPWYDAAINNPDTINFFPAAPRTAHPGTHEPTGWNEFDNLFEKFSVRRCYFSIRVVPENIGWWQLTEPLIDKMFQASSVDAAKLKPWQVETYCWIQEDTTDVYNWQQVHEMVGVNKSCQLRQGRKDGWLTTVYDPEKLYGRGYWNNKDLIGSMTGSPVVTPVIKVAFAESPNIDNVPPSGMVQVFYQVNMVFDCHLREPRAVT